MVFKTRRGVLGSIIETYGGVIKKNATTAKGNTVQVNIENVSFRFYFMVAKNASKKIALQIMKS